MISAANTLQYTAGDTLCKGEYYTPASTAGLPPLVLVRMQGAVAAARTIPGADLSRMGAMGYCFGGMAVLDLARAGGEDDPLVPPEQVAAFKAEMNAKQVDWQLHAYSHTVHAFTRPAANDPAFGAVYNAAANRRSWQSMLNFFNEVL